MNYFSDDCQYFVTEVMPHYEYVRRLIYTITDSEALALDIVQETMLRAWKNLDKIKRYQNKKASLSTIARNALADYLRKHGKEMDSAQLADVMMEDCIESDAASMVIEMENKSEFFAKVNMLTGNQQKVILLYYYFEMPLKEIGEALQMNYNTVLSLHRRGINAMRKKMGSRIGTAEENTSGSETL